MPTPPLTDEQCQEAFDAWKRHYRSHEKAAAELGIPRNTFAHRLKTAKARGLSLDPAIKDSMQAVGTGLVPALTWAKTKSQDGTSYSVLLKPEAETDEALFERIRTAFSDIDTAPAAPEPAYADEDLMTVYPLADVHMGMMAWGKETGEDYDTKLAASRVREWLGRCVAASPASDTAVLLDVGDLTHADDQNNQTPRSKHILDVDTRFYRTLDVTIATLGYGVDMLLRRHNRVLVRILPGNHNPHSYLAVMFALAERYRNEPRVTVVRDPGEFWVHQFGDVLLAAHHGDKAKAERMVLWMAEQHAAVWGATKYRYLFTGHLHHHKSADIGGVQWEQLRAVTARDAYAVSHAYSARAQMQAITYHKARGEISRVKTGL